MKVLSGIVIPLVTPFTEEGEVDTGSLKKLTEYLIGKGVDCLYPCGTTGEMNYLSLEERKLVVETIVRQAAGRLPVFAQVGAATTADTVELARHAAACGADGIGVVTPWYLTLSEKELEDFFVTVAGSVPEGFPMYLYGIPQNAVNDITPELAERVAARCPNVIGIKYSYPDMTRIQSFMTVRNGDFSVLVGPDHLYQAAAAVGGKGTVSGNAMIIPEYYGALRDALGQGDQILATVLQRKINVLNGILCEGNNIAGYKAVLKALGILSSKKLRPPMEELSDQEEEKLMARLQQMHYQEVETE